MFKNLLRFGWAQSCGWREWAVSRLSCQSPGFKVIRSDWISDIPKDLSDCKVLHSMLCCEGMRDAMVSNFIFLICKVLSLLCKLWTVKCSLNTCGIVAPPPPAQARHYVLVRSSCFARSAFILRHCSTAKYFKINAIIFIWQRSRKRIVSF